MNREIIPFLYKSIQLSLITKRNRFISRNNWNEFALNTKKIKIINQVESDGVLILEDYITKKYGKEIFGTNWHQYITTLHFIT